MLNFQGTSILLCNILFTRSAKQEADASRSPDAARLRPRFAANEIFSILPDFRWCAEFLSSRNSAASFSFLAGKNKGFLLPRGGCRVFEGGQILPFAGGFGGGFMQV